MSNEQMIMLGDALRSVLVRDNVLSPTAEPTGPELILAASDYIASPKAIERLNVSQIFDNNKNEDLLYLLSELLGQIPRKNQLDTFIKDAEGNTLVDIECKVGGYVVSINKLAEFLIGTYSKNVQIAAKEMIKERLENMQSDFSKLIERFERSFNLPEY